MGKLPISGATMEDLDVVSRLVRGGDLYIAVEGVWVSPEVLFERGSIVLHADMSDAIDESD